MTTSGDTAIGADDSAGEAESGGNNGTDTQQIFTVRVANVAPTDFCLADSATGGQIRLTPGGFPVYSGKILIFSVGDRRSGRHFSRLYWYGQRSTDSVSR